MKQGRFLTAQDAIKRQGCLQMRKGLLLTRGAEVDQDVDGGWLNDLKKG